MGLISCRSVTYTYIPGGAITAILLVSVNPPLDSGLNKCGTVNESVRLLSATSYIPTSVILTLRHQRVPQAPNWRPPWTLDH